MIPPLRRLSAVAAGLLLGAGLCSVLAAPLDDDQWLAAREGLRSARAMYATSPAAARRVLTDLATRSPWQFRSVMLEEISIAGANSPEANDGFRREEEQEFYRLAASVLSRTSGLSISQAWLEEALSPGSGGEQREAGWDLMIVDSSAPAGSAPGARALEAAESFEAADDAVGMSRALSMAADHLVDAGDHAGAAALYASAARSAESAGDGWYAMRCRMAEALARSETGEDTRAFLLYDAAASAAEEMADVPSRAEALRGAGNALRRSGDPRQAIGRLLEAARLLGDGGRGCTSDASAACAEAARLALEHEDQAQAEEYLKQGLALASEISDDRSLAALLLVKADLLMARQQPREAAATLEKALEQFRESADDSGMAEAASRLGALLADRRPASAAAYYREAAEAAAAAGDEERAGRLIADSAELALRRNVVREAERSVRIAVGEDWEMNPDDVDRVRLVSGSLLLEGRKYREAAAEFGALRSGQRAARARWGEALSWLAAKAPAESAAAASLALELTPGMPPLVFVDAALRAHDAGGATGLAAEIARRVEPAGGEVPVDAPSDPEPLRRLAAGALMELRAGRPERALQVAARLAASGDGEMLLAASRLFALAGRAKDAEAAFDRARATTPDPLLVFALRQPAR